jgi:hypothetical protein
MAVDKGYGSGKSRSAANSAARRRAAAGQLSKSKKGIASQFKSMQAKQAASPLGQAADFLLGFALPVGKVKAAAAGLRAAGKAAQAAPLANRLVAKSLGKDAGRLIAQNRGATNSFIRENVIGNAKKVRNLSAESTFPRAPKKGPMGQPDLGDLGAGRVGLPYNTPAQIRRTNRARQAAQQGTRVTELEKRLNFPTSTRGFGTVNPEGYAALQKLPDFLGKGAKQIARKIKKTPQRGGR